MRILDEGRRPAPVGSENHIAPHTDGPPQHRHARHDEGFYVVSGTARFTVGETVYDAPAGTLVMIPPGAPHTFANPTDEHHGHLKTLARADRTAYSATGRQIPRQPLTAEATIAGDEPYATEPATDFA